MRKKFMIMAAALFAVMSFSANAQTPNTTPQNKMRQARDFTEYAFEGILLDINQQTRIDSLNAAVKGKAPVCAKAQCPEGKQCDKAECPEAKKCDKAQCPEGKQCDKAQCPEGKKCDKAQCPEGKKCDKAQCPEGKKCDKAQCPEGKQCDKACKGEGRRGMAPKGRCPYGEEYVAKVKEILTPEQYTVFLENIVSMPAPQKANHKMVKAKDAKYNGPKATKGATDKQVKVKEGKRDIKKKK